MSTSYSMLTLTLLTLLTLLRQTVETKFKIKFLFLGLFSFLSMTVPIPLVSNTPNKEPQGGGLDKIDAKAFVRFYSSIPIDSDPSGGAPVIRFFDRKSYISVHGYDGEPYIVSRILYKSVAQVVHVNGGGRPLPSITLTHQLLPIILKELLVPSSADAVKYRVEYWQEGQSGQSGQSGFGLVSASSPGRLDPFMEEQVRVDGWACANVTDAYGISHGACPSLNTCCMFHADLCQCECVLGRASNRGGGHGQVRCDALAPDGGFCVHRFVFA